MSLSTARLATLAFTLLSLLTLSASAAVAAAPQGAVLDLSIVILSVPAPETEPGTEYSFRVAVTNEGLAPAPHVEVRAFLENETDLGFRRLAVLLPGATEIVEFPWTTQPHGHRLRVATHSVAPARILDADYSDNVARASFFVGGTVDLAPAFARLDSPPEGQDSFEIHVQNFGTGPSPAANGDVWRGPSFVESFAVPALPPLGVVVLSVPVTWGPLPAGPHALTVELDRMNEVVETNDTNNLLSFQGRVAYRRDLATPSDLGVGDVPLAAGVPTTFRVQVLNLGNAPVDNATLEVRVDGVLASVKALPELPAVSWSTSVYTDPWVPTEGEHHVEGRIVLPTGLLDVNLSNNRGGFRATVGPPPPAPDLAVSILSVVEQPLAVGPAAVAGSTVGPRDVTVQTCAAGRDEVPETWASLGLQPVREYVITPPFTHEFAEWLVPRLDAGTCDVRVFRLEPLRAFGEFDIVLYGFPPEGDPNPTNNEARVRETVLVAGAGGFASPLNPAFPGSLDDIVLPPLFPVDANLPLPCKDSLNPCAAIARELASNPRCAPYAAIDLATLHHVETRCAWPEQPWSPYTDGTGIRDVDHLPLYNSGGDFCTLAYDLFRLLCDRIAHPSGENIGVGAPTGLSYRLPQLRPSDVMGHVIRYASTGEWGGDIWLGDYKHPLLGGSWTPLRVPGPPPTEAATLPSQAWGAANAALDQEPVGP